MRGRRARRDRKWNDNGEVDPLDTPRSRARRRTTYRTNRQREKYYIWQQYKRGRGGARLQN